MNLNFKEFWESTPNAVDKAIAFAVATICVGLGIGLGFALGKSTRVEVNSDGVVIEKQAIAAQKDLEYALFLVKSLQGIIEQYETDAVEFSRRYKAGEKLAEQAQFAAEFIPEQQIEKLEERVEQSKVLLEESFDN